MKLSTLSATLSLLVAAAIDMNAAVVLAPLDLKSGPLCYDPAGLALCLASATLTPDPPSVVQNGPDQTSTSPIALSGALTVGGAPAGGIGAAGPHGVTIFGRPALSSTGVFDIEVTQLDLDGLSALGPLRLRESPTLASLGKTKISDLGGGNFQIDSFFDVFIELSIDGGQSWLQSQTGAARFESADFNNNVPEPGSFLLVSGAVLALLAGRRRRSA